MAGEKIINSGKMAGLNSMSYFLYAIFGVVPSVIWLLFYLRKDSHPESNRQIIKVFVFGALIAIPAIFLEIGIFKIFETLNFPIFLTAILNVFIGVAFVEEFLKYLTVKILILKHSEFDEPIDAMLYMIIAALGFAALENILILLQLGPNFFWTKTFEISIFRFLGATFLHTLSSGLIGYFLALSLCRKTGKTKLIFIGLGISVALHGLYNFSIIKADGDLKLLVPLIILVALTIFTSFGFKKLQKLASVCRI